MKQEDAGEKEVPDDEKDPLKKLHMENYDDEAGTSALRFGRPADIHQRDGPLHRGP